MRIFLDDIRATPEMFDKTFRTGETFLTFLKNNPNIEIDHISFDHDLGENRIDGYEVVQKIVDMNISVKLITFHTDNLVGLKNMYYYFKSAQKVGAFNPNTVVDKMKYNSIDGNFSNSGYSPIKN